MAGKPPPKKLPPFPNKDEVLEFIRDNGGKVGKREIARAFQITGNDKIVLKRMLKELEAEGEIDRHKGRRFSEHGTLPEVTVLDIHDLDRDGELIARPQRWDHDGKPPVIYISRQKRGRNTAGLGDRVLARLSRNRDGSYNARVIKRIDQTQSQVIGIFMEVEGEGRVMPTSRKNKYELAVIGEDRKGAERGDLVAAEVLPGKHYGLRKARITERLGRMGEPKSVSLIAIHTHDIPLHFPSDVIAEAEAAGPAPLGHRTDLRDIPLVTIDGEDARDFDDAVWAEPDTDPNNEGGWHIMVAIADVSWYVRPGSPLDKSAYQRGNSVYFPDRVVPMLPEALSNGWCSLVPHEERPCLAVHMWITSDGTLKRHQFVRGLMKSSARLTYTQVQAARDGQLDETASPLLETVITPLYGAYEALQKGRARRGVLELDLPEKRILLDDQGNVKGVVERERHDSHRLIEEFMITANVAAAETLERKHMPCMYRIHDEPAMEKLEALREFLGSLNIKLPKGQVLKPAAFNHILGNVPGTPHAQLVSEVILRSQAQAIYSPDNLGHFGLALRRYAHFTSPIRRYADLLVHRALVHGLNLGDGGLEPDHKDFEEMGEHISITERRAQVAEREVVDRYTALYLADHVGDAFTGRISGVTRFGLFVTLDESGGDGLVPISSLPGDWYEHDEAGHRLVSNSGKRQYRLGDVVEVQLAEANPITGSMVLKIMEDGAVAESDASGSFRRAGARRGRPRKSTKGRKLQKKAKRKH